MVYPQSFLVLLMLGLALGISLKSQHQGMRSDGVVVTAKGVDVGDSSPTLLQVLRQVAAVESDVGSSLLRSIRSSSTTSDGAVENDVLDMKLKAECAIFGTKDSYDNIVFQNGTLYMAMVRRTLRTKANMQRATTQDSISCLNQMMISYMNHRISDRKQIEKEVCIRPQEFNQCYSRRAEAISFCSPPAERASAKKFMRSIVDFYCTSGRIRTFITEGGVDCFEQNKDELEQCVRTAYSSEREKDGVPTSSLVQRTCTSRALLRGCVRGHLEKCDRPTALNYFNAYVQAEGSGWSCPFLEESTA